MNPSTIIFTNHVESKLYSKLAELYPDLAHKITPTVITGVKKIKSGESGYVLHLNESTAGTTTKDIERRIKPDEVFFPFGYSVQVGKIVEDDDTDKSGNAFFYPYPDQTIFGFAGTSGLPEDAALQTVFNGSFSVKSSNETVYDEISNRTTEQVPTQQVFGKNHASVDYGNIMRKLWAVKGLSGDRSNKVELKLAAGDYTNIEGDAAKKSPNYIIIDFYGFTVGEAVAHPATEAMQKTACSI